MQRKAKIILIGNYPLDKLESMDRFAKMLLDRFKIEGITAEIWYPNIFLGSIKCFTSIGLRKWINYIDKWIIFPFILRKRLIRYEKDSKVYFHICDHSNAPYLKYLPIEKSGITCHDVLAIRGAFGYADAYCPASRFGKILQKWILHHLCRARFIACVSQLTLSQLEELNRNKSGIGKKWIVIHNSLNNDFRRIDYREAKNLIQKLDPKLKASFFLHVGSGLARKNRKLLIDVLAILGDKWRGNICFAGEELSKELIKYAKSLGLFHRIISIVKPDHATLQALYNACEAFIFPSFSEGFGWPVIEAQACGAPVIISNIEPLPEVSGNAALLADPTKPEQFAEAFLSLQCKNVRAELIERGFANILRFESSRMTAAYLNLYE